MAHSHRSAAKRGHKGFKSKHASKGEIKRRYKGKVEKDVKKGKTIKGVSRLDRKNNIRQVRLKKIADSLEIRKLFDGANGAEKIITVIPLASDVLPTDILAQLLQSFADDITPEQQESLATSPSITNVHIKNFKSNLKFIIPDMSNFLNILDCAKVADFVVFGLSGVSEIDQEFGEQIIRALELQGISSYIGVVTNLSKVHPKEKFQLDVKQSLESFFKHFFPNQDRIYNLEKPSEASNALRLLCQRYPRSVGWRDNRGYLIADNIEFQDTDNSNGSEMVNLTVEGTVRGTGFDVGRLVHIPGLGDFQLNGIEKLSSSMRKKKVNPKTDDVLNDLDNDLNNRFSPDGNRDTLEEYAPQDLELEQWSDEEDFEYDNLTAARYDDHGFLPGREQQARKIKVPKGTSDYQAKWYLDDVVEVSDTEEVEDNIDEQDLMDEEIEMDEEDNMDENVDEIPDDEDTQTEAAEEMFEDLSPEEEERQWQEYRSLESEDREFPDEVELMPTESGVDRLKRYRGLKNLHNCIWNYDEKDPLCPPEYKRLLRIGDYKNVRNRILKENKKNVQVISGDRVKLYINFPKHLLEKVTDPKQILFPVYGLLLHEHKNAMVNFSIQRWEEYEEPVPSKEPIVVQYGVRRYVIQPLYSSASNTPNNVHKYERFLHQNTVSIATCMAPVDFTQSPAIFFKPNANDPKGIELIGSGTFLNADHTRVLAKRAVLTGHPFRFHKKVVTVRYMFFNPEDVEWFKSIPLFTKTGRSGFIKESLGTHGYFKATFDGKLSAQDVVAMSLFKRMWPMTSLPWNGEQQ
ncbi:hypothetical protein Kpol_483p14 [Vanderwaltozyma polyspora DSM 70294]|uniref:Bms1-type G domain-containing protein n=1 Tax=Vanderwaltozyma polyspora (strain ATCC 22028 / DSM 70294 / BCRC 21397 / CBS 2163 / NBRC 10782 / NRRL Y-8283 / UCD 57-17) TaxID=436907 RepID=A7TQ66_VANPO|nr:uncharacterized protein Kpol_483p14 [Vanderwaltozyma polyspora DSM 70294]EDO15595.1 hypothetical protein Kpol_483p14 [Vanderwaltozyma polyspora DSM 70294]